MMKKITLLLTFLVTGILANVSNAQHSFASVPGPTLVTSGSPTTLSVNDAGNTAAAPASSTGTYSTFSVTVDWEAVGGGPWSSEADLTVTTTAGSVNINPATSGSADTGTATALTFDGTFTSPYDPTVDGFLDIVLDQTWGGSSANWSNIVVTIYESPSCLDPVNFALSNVTSSSVDITWDDPTAGAQLEYEYVVQAQGGGEPVAAGTYVDIFSLPLTVTDDFSSNPLAPATDYEVWVRAICGGSDSAWVGPFDFTTACVTFTVPSMEDFSTYVPSCWEEADNGDLVAGPATFGTSGWIADGFGTNNGTTTTGSARYNIFLATANDWLLTPLFDIPATGYELKFDAAVTDYNSSTLTDVWESDDYVEVLVSTGTTNWTVLYTYNDANVPSNAGTTNIIDLDAYSGQQVRFAFRAVEGAADGSSDIDFMIDNFEIRLTPVSPPACATNIVANPDASCGNFPTVITWDVDAGADGYYLTLGTSTGSNDILDNVDLGSVNSYSFTGNISSTYYYTLVPYNTNGPAAGCSEMSFSTVATGCYCVPTYASSGDSDQITNIAIGAWSNASSGNPAPSYVDYTTQQPGTIAIPDIAAGTTITVDVTMGTDGSQFSRVWIDFNQNYTFEASESFSLGTNAGASGTSSIVVSIPPGATLGQTLMRVRGGSDGAILDTQACGAATSNWGEAEDYLVNIIMASCTPVTIASTNVVPNCGSSEFNIEVDVTDLGDGTPTISDGTNSWPVSSTGIITLGPFASGTSVTLDVLHGSDNTCDLPIGTFSYVCPPSNDECDNAIVLTVNADLNCGVVTSATNFGATASAQADDVTGTPNNDVWFSFVATGDSHIVSLSNVVAASGTSTDMGMGVYDATGGCMSLTFVADSDPNSLTLTGLTIGNTYLVRVYNWGATITNTDNFDICVGTPPAPPVNDECDNAIALTVNADLNCGVVTAGTNVSATASAQADDVTGTPNNDVWFSFDATSTSHVVSLLNVVAVTGTSTDMGMGVYDATGGCMALAFVADSDPNSLTLTGLTIGNTYLVRVYNWGATATNTDNFDICVGTPPAPPANDECDNAIALTVNADLNCGVVTAGTNVSATASAQADDVTGTPNNDVWFSFDATATSHVVSLLNVVAATGTSTNMGMGVYDATGGCMALAFVADSDPNSLTLTGLTIGNTYLVRVYNWTTTITNTNNFDICVGTPPPPPVNDDCDNAIALIVNTDYNCGVVTSATNASATASAQVDDVTGTPNNDVWFSFDATQTAHRISLLNVVAATGTSVDMGMGVYDATGGCMALTFVADSDPNTLNLTGLTIGNTYLVRVYNWGTNAANTDNFDICVGTDPALSSSTFDSNSFVAYPNPVRDILTLEYSSDITSVRVVNMLGQEVLARTINATSTQVDMSALAAGTYLVNVTSGDVQKTIKVVKQ